MKIALIHDALTVYGGAEKVLEEFHSIFPSAPIYVPVYKQEAVDSGARCNGFMRTGFARLCQAL